MSWRSARKYLQETYSNTIVGNDELSCTGVGMERWRERVVAGKKEQDYVMRTDAKSDKAPNKHNLNFSSSIGVHGVSGIAFMGAHGCQNRQSHYSNTEIACCEGAPISRRLFQHHEHAVTTKARAARFNGIKCIKFKH